MLKLFSRYVHLKTVLLLVTENVLITGTLAALLQWWARSLVQDDVGLVALRVAFITLIFQVSLFYNDLYDLSMVHTRSELLIRTLQSFGAAGVLLSLLFLLFPVLTIGEGNYVVLIFLVGGVTFVLRWGMTICLASRVY